MKFFIRFFSACLFLVFATFNCFAQNKTISGKVLDACGNPIPYASVYPKKFPSFGGTSDINGSYEVNIPANLDTLMCTRSGYINITEPIEGSTVINFTLKEYPVKVFYSTVTGTHKYSKEEKNKALVKEGVEDNKDRIFTKVEISASFAAGSLAYQEYLNKTIIYPDSATISDVNGVVKVSFTIAKDGSVKNVKLVKGVNKFADEAVMNAILKMPRWNAANQNGRAIEDNKEVSVRFDIKGVD